ncbi:MAG TPA: sodium-dependent bicarbonate transport family permease, partial [Burkholderiaceae bacterium]|nr:sodium-dependent bicarbonate transport family permease [Burkholderiaceae bacterium]
GLKGGFALAASGFTAEVSVGLACAVALAVVVPLVGYALLRHVVGGFDAAAIAATYGSVSAVTFITAVQHLDSHAMAYGAHMAAAMALMESPAIVIAVVIANGLRRQVGASGAAQPALPTSIGPLLREALTDGAQLLLLGAMAVGWLTGAKGQAAMQPFAVDLFKGMLALFLLDMGLLAARHMGQIRGRSTWLLVYSIAGPLMHAGLALALAAMVGMTAGNAALLMALAASASYIAVPVALRHALPEASPTLYFGMSLGVTFPFNILLGIPFYAGLAQRVLG